MSRIVGSVPYVALVQDSVFAGDRRPAPAASLVTARRLGETVAIDDDQVSDLAMALSADAVLVEQSFVLDPVEFGAWCAAGFAGWIPAPVDGSALPDPWQKAFVVQGSGVPGGVLVFRMTERGPVRFAVVPDLMAPGGLPSARALDLVAVQDALDRAVVDAGAPVPADGDLSGFWPGMDGLADLVGSLDQALADAECLVQSLPEIQQAVVALVSAAAAYTARAALAMAAWEAAPAADSEFSADETESYWASGFVR